MKAGEAMLAAMILSGALLCGCGLAANGGGVAPPQTQAEAPKIATASAQNGAVIVSLASSTAGAQIYYTVDGSTPTSSSPKYEAPFLVASNLTVKAMAWASGHAASSVTSQTFALNIPSGTLVWSDEFSNASSSDARPDPAVWTYDTGNDGFGNHELETYCAWGSNASPCDASSPNAYVGTDGYLHIVAQQTSPGVYTSARMKTQGLFSLQYGRVEFRAKVPESQGFWPAAWLLGNNIATINWPGCGEMDVLERVDAAGSSHGGASGTAKAGAADWNEGSVHGPGFVGSVGLGTVYNFPAGETAAGWHTYGMIWKPGSVEYYVDDPGNTYITYTNPASLTGLTGAVWPFDAGESSFLILNLAVGGDWPGSPSAATPFPSQMLVDYVRVYTN